MKTGEVHLNVLDNYINYVKRNIHTTYIHIPACFIPAIVATILKNTFGLHSKTKT